MRINSVVATSALHADTTTEVAAQTEHAVAASTEHAPARSNPFAVLGEPLFRARADFKYEQREATTVSGANESNPAQVTKRHGIIIIGGSQDHAAASPLSEIKTGPQLQGIIIVGGSTPGQAIPKKSAIVDQRPLRDLDAITAEDRMGNFEIQRLMSAFNQAETLSSNVQKKIDDTVSGQQQKIG